MDFQSLPVELVTDILNLLIPDSWELWGSQGTAWLRLRLVSRFFSNIILDIIFHKSNRFALINSKTERPDVIAWLLSTKVKLDRPGADKTSTYLHQWAAFMAAQHDWEESNASEYDVWLDGACRAAIHELGPVWVREYLVKSTDGVLLLGLDPGSSTEIAALGSSISLRDHIGNSKVTNGAIQLACAAGNVAAVKWLLSGGADPSTRHPLFGVPLYNAVRKGDITVVRSLFECGTCIHPREGYATLKMLAVRHGHSAAFKYLLENTPGEDFDLMKTCRVMACEQGNEEITDTLNEWSKVNTKRAPQLQGWVGRLGICLSFLQKGKFTCNPD